MNSYNPIMLRLIGKKVVVVGGGKVAERKVTGLLETGARITVISPTVTGKLQRLANEKKIIWCPRPFTADDVKESQLIFAATNDPQVNRCVKDSAKPHQLVTIADCPDASDFHLPSQLKRGRLTIAVSTGGASPILARKIRMDLEQQFDQSYDDYLEFLFVKRQWIRKNVENPVLKKKLLTAIVSEAFLTSGNREEDFQQLYKEWS